MTIIADEHLIGIWFVDFARDGRDWMGGLSRHSEGKFRFLWRTRHHRDQKIFGSEDVKRWSEGIHTGTEQDALERARKFVSLLAQMQGGTSQFELLVGDKTLDQFAAELNSLPFAHGKEMTDQEYRQEYGQDAARPKP